MWSSENSAPPRRHPRRSWRRSTRRSSAFSRRSGPKGRVVAGSNGPGAIQKYGDAAHAARGLRPRLQQRQRWASVLARGWAAARFHASFRTGALAQERHMSRPSPAQLKALFLDRDGTLIIDKDYLADPAGVELFPGVAGALAEARRKGYLLFLFTNQSGIGRGYHSLADAEAVNARMEAMLGLGSPLFTETCIAPEAPDQPSLYRKPSPRFLLEAAQRHGLDPAHSWMVGDKESDIDSGLNAGMRVAAVCSGKLSAADWQARPRPGLLVFDTLTQFVAQLP
ncbi:MAG TPA: HAD-IIIA family hydrolase [Candidatus Didemnitutus sp.]|nr:HAD-IIIA family hydrolase [Candidatus Didemnitutus sp.]